MADELSDAMRHLLVRVLLPMRHLEWGANMNNTFIAAYSYGTAINAATMFAAMDRLGIAQQVSRIGLAVGDEAALDEAKEAWLTAPEWQPLRHLVEDSFVVKDWFELFLLQNLVLDALVYQFLYVHLDKKASRAGGAFYGLATKFMKDWQAETNRWVDSVVKAAVAESAENKALIQGWLGTWGARAAGAVKGLAVSVFAGETDAVMDTLDSDLRARLARLGL
jgi:phenol hydroxylase P1 protein